MTAPALILDMNHLLSFLLAGRAKFTLLSKKTGERKTFLVEQKGKEEFWFVKLLTGPDNTSDFRYLCALYMVGLTGAKSLKTKLNKDAWGEDAYQAFGWLVSKINANDPRGFYAQAEFWHAGECGRCGRELTDPESIKRGLGPTCAGKS